MRQGPRLGFDAGDRPHQHPRLRQARLAAHLHHEPAAVHVGRGDIDDQQVGAFLTHERQGFGRLADFPHGVSVIAQQRDYETATDRLGVENQYVSHASSAHHSLFRARA